MCVMQEDHIDSFLVEDFPYHHRSMRIAMVTETYPPEINGVALTVARLVQGLRAKGHEVQLVRPRQGLQDEDHGPDATGFEEVLTRGIPIPKYSHLRMGALSKRKLIRLWSLKRPDVVHIATEGPLGWSALQAAVHLQLPVCSDFRTNFHAYCRHYGMAWLQKPVVAYLRKFHNRTDCTMVPTEALRQELAVLGFQNLRVLARGIDTELFCPSKRSDTLRAQWGADTDTPVALCVGRLAPEKNLDCALQAFEQMRLVRPSARLVLVGDGPARESLRQKCPTAIFAGFQSGDALAAHYASADIFLFPSVTETFGNVTPEAMASGLAVVAFDYAAAAQLIQHTDNGCLAPLQQAQKFHELATSLVADLPQARQMGARARLALAHASWERIVVQIEAIFAQAIARPSARISAARALDAPAAI